MTGKLEPHSTPLLVVISGPSGVGKDAVLNHLKKTESRMRFVITMTTRNRRPKEIDGVHYNFVNNGVFQKLRETNELLESASVYGNWYGVPKQPIRDALKAGQDTVVKVDVQGAATIKKLIPHAVFIFLMPPSLTELKNRLRQRYTEKPHELEIRFNTAASEIKKSSRFDYIVVNHKDDLDTAIAQIKAILIAEKCRARPRKIVIP